MDNSPNEPEKKSISDFVRSAKFIAPATLVVGLAALYSILSREKEIEPFDPEIIHGSDFYVSDDILWSHRADISNPSASSTEEINSGVLTTEKNIYFRNRGDGADYTAIVPFPDERGHWNLTWIAAELSKRYGIVVPVDGLYGQNKGIIGSNPDLIQPGMKLTYSQVTQAHKGSNRVGS